MKKCEACGKEVDDLEIYEIDGVQKCPQCALGMVQEIDNAAKKAVQREAESQKAEAEKNEGKPVTVQKKITSSPDNMQNSINFADTALKVIFIILGIAGLVACAFMGPVGMLIFIPVAGVLFVIYNFGVVFLEMAQNVLEIKKQLNEKADEEVNENAKTKL